LEFGCGLTTLPPLQILACSKYSKPSIIRINEAKIAPKNKKKKLRKQINGKFNNIGTTDEINKKNITAAISSSVRS
jgi:hypothetical protein